MEKSFQEYSYENSVEPYEQNGSAPIRAKSPTFDRKYLKQLGLIHYKETSYFSRALCRLLIAFFNFKADFWTWTSIFFMSGVNLSVLYSALKDGDTIGITLIFQLVILGVYLIGIFILMFKDINWWQLSYQIEAVKKDHLCRLVFVLTSINNTAMQTYMWLKLRGDCQGQEEKFCQVLLSPTNFLFTSVSALIGLLCMSIYSGSLHGLLPYDAEVFDYIQIPRLKIGGFSIPMVWIFNTNNFFTSIEIMLNLIRNAHSADEDFDHIRKAYDYLSWEMLEGIQREPKMLNMLKEQFMSTRTKFEIIDKPPRKRFFDERGPKTKLFLRRSYVLLFVLILWPIVLLLCLSTPFLVLYSRHKNKQLDCPFGLLILFLISLPILIVGSPFLWIDHKFFGLVDRFKAKLTPQNRKQSDIAVAL